MTIRSIHGEPGMVFVGYDTDGECLWDYPENKMEESKPKQAKGGVFAPSDMKLIKEALIAYAQNTNLDHSDQRAVTNLLHRINNRT